LDYGHNSTETHDLLVPLIGMTQYINIDRAMRCVLFLAKGSVEKLKFYVNAALVDARDVVFWAEYTDHSKDNPLRVNDFSKPFNS
jgi:hypothetical protein